MCSLNVMFLKMESLIISVVGGLWEKWGEVWVPSLWRKLVLIKDVKSILQLNVVGCGMLDKGGREEFAPLSAATDHNSGDFGWDGVGLIGTLSSTLIWIHRCCVVGKVEAEAGVDAVVAYRTSWILQRIDICYFNSLTFWLCKNPMWCCILCLV